MLTIIAAIALMASAEERITVSLTDLAVSEGLLASLPGAPSNSASIWELNTDEVANAAEIISSGMTLLGVLPSRAYQLPKVKRLSQPFTISLNAGLERFASILGSDLGEDEQFDRLWIDWNRNHAFEQSEFLKGVPMKVYDQRYLYFGPISVPSGPGRPSSLGALLSPQLHDIAMPTGFLTVQSNSVKTGELSLGSKKSKFIVVDTNLDGRYEPWSGGDSICIDFDGSGKFEAGPMALMQASHGEAIFLTEFVQLHDGGLYDLSVSEDGATMTFVRNTSKYGRIGGFKPGTQVFVKFKGIAVSLLASDGSIGLPQGHAEVRQAEFAVADAQGKLYSFLASGEPYSSLEVKPGQLSMIPSALPFKVTLEIGDFEGAYTLSVNLTDQLGRTIINVQDPNGKEISAGRMTIRDAKGMVLFQKTDAYNTWSPPKGVKGPFTVTATLNLGPLGNLTATKIVLE